MAKVPVHPDRRVQALLEQVRERESAQGLDRLRLVHRQRPARVINLSSTPLDVTVDRLVTWREIMPTRLERAAARGHVLPLSKAELARVYPDLWATPKAAEHDLTREKVPISQIVESIWGLGPFSGQISYWRAPSQCKPFRAVMYDCRTGRAGLEAGVGPVLRIEVEPTTGAGDADGEAEAANEAPP